MLLKDSDTWPISSLYLISIVRVKSPLEAKSAEADRALSGLSMRLTTTNRTKLETTSMVRAISPALIIILDTVS